jgi:hypothetical protein
VESPLQRRVTAERNTDPSGNGERPGYLFLLTGAAVSDPTGMHAIKTGSWTGQNKLGNTLTRIRDASLAEFPGYQYRLDTLRGQYNPETF